MMATTEARWADFKAKRAAQYERDEKIKAFIKDFLGLLEIVSLAVMAWFFLAVLYA